MVFKEVFIIKKMFKVVFGSFNYFFFLKSFYIYRYQYLLNPDQYGAYPYPESA